MQAEYVAEHIVIIQKLKIVIIQGNLLGSGNNGVWIGGICGRNGTSNGSPKGIVENSYCLNNVSYSYAYWNGSTNTTTTSGKVPDTTLKGYASTLGEAFTNDVQNPDGTWKYNNGYPILKWQLQENQVTEN